MSQSLRHCTVQRISVSILPLLEQRRLLDQSASLLLDQMLAVKVLVVAWQQRWLLQQVALEVLPLGPADLEPLQKFELHWRVVPF